VRDFLLYGMSLPERALRSASGVVGGAVQESASLLVPQALRDIRQKGIYASLAETSRPYIDAVWLDFSTERTMLTEDVVSGKLICQAWGRSGGGSVVGGTGGGRWPGEGGRIAVRRPAVGQESLRRQTQRAMRQPDPPRGFDSCQRGECRNCLIYNVLRLYRGASSRLLCCRGLDRSKDYRL
jgi:hypothetical protein